MLAVVVLGLGLIAARGVLAHDDHDGHHEHDDGDHNQDGDHGHDDDHEDGARPSRFDALVRQGIDISPVPISIEELDDEDRQEVGYGSYLVNAVGACADCHGGPPKFLAGGTPFQLDATHVVWSRNLTPDPASGLHLSKRQFVEAIRTGRDFHPGATRALIVMPWPVLRWMSDSDLRAIYDYLRAIPPQANAVPPDQKDDLPLPPFVSFPDAYTDGDVQRRLPDDDDPFGIARGLAIQPLAAPTGLHGQDRALFGRGSYLANAVAGCNDCHTNPDRDPVSLRINTAGYLAGGAVFDVPPPLAPLIHQTRTMSEDLTGAMHGFFHEPGTTFDVFEQLIMTGTHVDEVPPTPLGFPMPWRTYRNMVHEDLEAIFTYVANVPARTGANDKATQPLARYCAADVDCLTGETCATTTHECAGGSCAADQDCSACQTCSAGHCAPPAAGSPCLTSGL
jgi:hypothetical protein